VIDFGFPVRVFVLNRKASASDTNRKLRLRILANDLIGVFLKERVT